MFKLHNFKYVSDGKKAKVYLDDKEIKGVSSVDFSADVNSQSEVTIRLYVGESEIIETITEGK